MPALLSFLHRVRLAQNFIRRHLVSSTGVTLGHSVVIGKGCEISLGLERARRGKITIGEHSRLERGVIFHPHDGSIALGSSVFLGPGTVIYGHGGVEIGADTLISMHCRILSSNHTIPPANIAIRSQPDILLPTKIGRDVWLGAGVTVLGGVTIGDGCVVGAGAVVAHDLSPGVIAVGVPARVIGTRPGPDFGK